jgi:histidyl-tRNA synthetase
MKRADASGAAYAVILGEDEIARQEATVKALRGGEEGGQQQSVAIDGVVDHIVQQIVGDDHDDHIHYHH